MCVNARVEFSCVMDAVPACLPAWGLGGQSVEFDEGLHVQLFNVLMALLCDEGQHVAHA